jgi:release factor glutamine methyltransferase
MPTWGELVTEAVADLARAGVPDADNSARWIGREATGTDATEWVEVVDNAATERQLASFDAMVARRSAGEPLQYVLGGWSFRSLELFVDDRVLIPRPETEVVAGHAIAETRRLVDAGTGPVIAVDLGTGSGAIGLSVAFEQPGVEVWLTDVSPDALKVARANLSGLGRSGGGVRLAEGDWFAALPAELEGRLGVVVSNPPYVADVDDLEPVVARWEPHLALLAGAAPGVDGSVVGGLAAVAKVVADAPRWLRPDGAVVLEMAPDQVAAAAELAARRFDDVDTFDDLAGRPRGIVARHRSR